MTSPVRTDGLAHAAAALRNLERRQAVIANNLANISTPGFKGELTFARLLEAGSTPVLDSATDRRTGPITTTGQALDVAIEGDGFLVVETGKGERLTRGGSLSVNDARLLVDSTGNAVLGEDDPHGGTRGPVTIPADATSVRIDKGGAVVVDGQQIARLRLERVPANVRLEHEGDGHFAAPDSRESIPVDSRGIHQGAIEESNVVSVTSMVDLIDVQRAYAGVQKTLTTIDFARGITVSDIGKPV